MIKILSANNIEGQDIFARCGIIENEMVSNTVREIGNAVISEGDKALLFYNEKFGCGHSSELLVSEEEIAEAMNNVSQYFLETLKIASDNITKYHSKQKRTGYEIKGDGNVLLGQKVTPLGRVGIYVPGGTASYPSTVLMNAIPANIAGVSEIVMVSPPDKEGKIDANILAAASIAGVKEIYKVGGAQAIFALAYGTKSIKPVDKIVGPGNIFVATAKRQVFGIVDIDMIAGPSEILVIADDDANAKWVAADMLSQAEHDIRASAVLICISDTFAKKVDEELKSQIAFLARADIARQSINDNGKIIVVNNIEEAIEISNKIAPEHLELAVNEPKKYLDSVINAGSIFLGNTTPEALGDYFAGTNHTLPTSGTARFSSPLSVDDFVKKSSYIYYDKEALGKVKDRIEDFATREGLTAHAKSVGIRFEEEEDNLK